MGFTLQSDDQYNAPCDGVFGFSDGTYDYLAGGWAGGTVTYDVCFRSSNVGVTFASHSTAPHAFHTGATCVVDGIAYLVGGDLYNKSRDGDWIRTSSKFEAGAWSQIAANPGIENRCLAALVFLNDNFYLIGGQAEANKTGTIYDTVLRSDDGLLTFDVILADTKTQGFRGGLNWGGVVVYRNLIWKICGGIYSGGLLEREYDTSIFSSPDGITWTYRGAFRGIGRHFHQCVVHNDKIYVFNGFSGAYTGANVLSSGNLTDYWTIEMLASGKIVQTYKGTTDWGAHHALTCWTNASGIMMFGGSGEVSGNPTQECWLFTE